MFIEEKKQFIIGDLNRDSLATIYNKYRPLIKPDRKTCIGSCRYMNYGKIYDQVKGETIHNFETSGFYMSIGYVLPTMRPNSS